MRRWRIAVILLAVALAIWFVAGILFAGRNETAVIPRGMQPLTLHGGRVTGDRMSTKSWSFRYRKAEMSPDGLIASVDGVRDGVLFKDGKPYLRVNAEHVAVNTQTFDFTASGDVHVTESHSGGARSFDTDMIQWNNAAKLLLLPHASVVRSGSQTLKVASIRVNFNTGEVTFGAMSGGVGF